MAEGSLVESGISANIQRRKPGPKKTWILTTGCVKACNRCGEEKPVDQFSPERRGIYGVSARCRPCRNSLKKEQYPRNRERSIARSAAYREAHPEKVRLAKASAMSKKLDYYRAKSSRWKKNNPDRVNANERARRVRLGEKVRSLSRDRQKRFRESKKSDGAYRLGRAFSSAVYHSLRSGKQGRSWVDLVPYSVDELSRHLERQFLSGMSWHNYGSVWHVDHIVPKSSFVYERADCDGFQACWALTNLRPLWKPDNLAKHARRTHLI